MTTDTKLKELIINKLTTSQYDSIEEKDPNQLYIVTDALGFDNTITKCLTKIPQDIKFELNNGTLTLKAGSKVYVPNGAGVFDTYTFTEDKTTIYTSLNNAVGFVYKTVSNNIEIIYTNYVHSGDSAPSGSTYMLWYDTANNLVKKTLDSGNTWTSGFSLPIALVYGTTSGLTSIDQTFNGFGYIGSTLFYLPNVQGKTANGLNSDGTYKGTDFTTTNVVTRTFSGDNGDRYLAIKGNLSISYNDYAGSNPAYYDKKINQFVRPGDSSPIWDDVCVFGLCTMTNGVISNFRPYSTFQAVDRNDSSWLSGLGMPSSRYIDLTLGASGSSYTAPANGWVAISKKNNATTQYVTLGIGNSVRFVGYNPVSGGSCETSLAVRKGQAFHCVYTAGGDLNFFRFIYAEGEN